MKYIITDCSGEKMKSKIKYILPDFTSVTRNKILLDIYEKFPYAVRENTTIYSFFGIFPNGIWNGGGTCFDYKNTSKQTMKKVRDFYNKRGIVVTFTFTNTLLKEEHLHDEYCNQMLEIFHNGMNEVLVASPILEKYIRENYPKYKINRSIINTEKVPFLLGDYHLSVVSKFKNKDFKFLNNLTEEEKSRTEILCNEFCIDNCPFAYQHYRESATLQLNDGKTENTNEFYGKCRYKEEPQIYLYKRLSSSSYRITYEDIVKEYAPLGFRYFKLGGRGIYNMGTIESLMHYLIKPEYQAVVRCYIIEALLVDYKKEQTTRLNEEYGYSEYLSEKYKNF